MFLPGVLDPTVDFLAELAGSGPVLELGIGTGRVALPLVEKGISVHGIDLSQAMVELLRVKPGGDAVEVTIGDFATTQVEIDFSGAHIWDTSAVVAVDAVVAKFAQRGITAELVGLNRHAARLHSNTTDSLSPQH